MNTRKSRSRSVSEPEMPAQTRPRRSSSVSVEGKPAGGPATSPQAAQPDSWVGSIRNYVWNFWNRIILHPKYFYRFLRPFLLESPDDSELNEESNSEYNLSMYEEQVRRLRELPPRPDGEGKEATPGTQPLSTQSSDVSSPLLSPKYDPYLTEPDFGITLEVEPEYNRQLLLMTDDLISKLHSGLPSRWRIASKWKLLYSTNFHGFSLATLFRRSRNFHGPVIVIIKDEKGDLFGAFATEPWLPHIGHFGTGECFLWRLEAVDSMKRVRRYKTTGDNNYFMFCETSFIAAGCGDGKFGLWLDECLEFGTSHTVPTFGNDPLSKEESFVCITLELWGLLSDE